MHTIRQRSSLGTAWTKCRPRGCTVLLLTLPIVACYVPITLEQGLGGPQRRRFNPPYSEEIGSLGEVRQPHPKDNRSEVGVRSPRELELGDSNDIVRETGWEAWGDACAPSTVQEEDGTL